MRFYKSQRIACRILSAFLCILILTNSKLDLCAAPATLEEAMEQAEERKSLPVQTNQIENWPAGPAISAQSAILMDANTGVILYAKNIDEKAYPASTTKLMTCLIAAENCKLDEMITFSHDAVFSIGQGSSNIGIDEGQAMPLEECLYGILVSSANEVANAVAEHVAGSMEAFAEMMNEKAAELGCQNTHFSNAHGLFEEDHYTSARDLALIAKAFFQNELLSKIGNTPFHHFQATATQPDDFTERNKHKLITGEIACEGIKGGKTGYTDESRQTLVTCAEQNGMKLICVVMKEETPDQFHDTVKLFSYGFANFSLVNVAENEKNYSIQNSNFFNTSSDVFGNSKPILTINQSSYLIMPKTTTFDSLDSDISYDSAQENQVAVINYYYHGAYVGNATVDLARDMPIAYDFTEKTQVQEPSPDQETSVVVINIKTVLIIILTVAALLIILFVIHSIISSYNFLDGRKGKRRAKKRRKRNRKEGPHFSSSRFKNFHF